MRSLAIVGSTLNLTTVLYSVFVYWLIICAVIFLLREDLRS